MRLKNRARRLGRQPLGGVAVGFRRRRADRAFAQRGGEQLGLDAERRELAFDQAVPVRAEIEDAGEQDREREDVDGENAQRDR